MLEHGAYCLLLDRYYATEQGIPADQAHRLARAKSKDERAAVDAVLAEFFTLETGIFVNGRASREVEKAQSKIKAAKQNGRLGGRPKGTQKEPSGLSMGSENRTQDQSKPNPLQTPDTRHQTNKDPPASRVPPAAAGKPRPAKKCPEDFTITAELAEWARTEAPAVDAVLELEKLRDHTFATARSDWPGTFRNWIRKAAERPAANVSFLAAKQAEAAKWANPPKPAFDYIDMDERNAPLALR